MLKHFKCWTDEENALYQRMARVWYIIESEKPFREENFADAYPPIASRMRQLVVGERVPGSRADHAALAAAQPLAVTPRYRGLITLPSGMNVATYLQDRATPLLVILPDDAAGTRRRICETLRLPGEQVVRVNFTITEVAEGTTDEDQPVSVTEESR